MLQHPRKRSTGKWYSEIKKNENTKDAVTFGNQEVESHLGEINF